MSQTPPTGLQKGIKKRGELINYGVQGPLSLRYNKPADKYSDTNLSQDLETDFSMARGVTPLANLGDEFHEEAELNEETDYHSTPPKANWSSSPTASDAQLSIFKEQLEPKIGTIESIKRVLGKPQVIVACLAIGTCVVYKIMGGQLVPAFSGGKTRRKKRNKKRTLRRKSK
jgi:hypothetical protein